MAWSKVQSSINAVTNGSVTTLSISGTQGWVSTTVGNWVVVSLFLFNTSSGSFSGISVTDSFSNTWTVTPNSGVGGGGANQYLFYRKIMQSSASITASWTGTANFVTLTAFEANWTGSGTPAFDKDAFINNGSSSTSVNTPSITPSASGEFLFAVCTPANNITAPVSGNSSTNPPWTGDQIQSAIGTGTEYILSSSSTSTAVNFTQNTAGTWLAGVLAIGVGSPAPWTPALYAEADPELYFYSAPNISRMWEEDAPAMLAAIPTLAWDEVDWQKSWDVRIPELIVQDEQPTEIPPIVIVWNPATGFAGADDWDWSQNISKYAIAASFEHEDWNPTLATPLIFFDEFEDQYESYKQAFPYFTTQSEEELPALLPTLPAILLKSDFDADDPYSRQYGLNYNLHDLDEDTGLQPIFVFVPDLGEDGQKGYFLVIAPPIHDAFEELSLIANFPPPAPPTWAEWGDDVGWQLSRDLRLSQATGEEDLIYYPIKIPTLAWDEIEQQKRYDLLFGGTQPEFHEDQTYGWFLSPFVPPIVFCPLPPFGPDADTSMSIFGGKQPTLALFCRICKSGKPLIVRADYAIWCQDCCAFVSKQDTYMGTIKAPGQFRGIF